MTEFTWRKSSYSATHQECVEVGTSDSATGVRDTKHRGAGYIAVRQDEWTQFLSAVKSGRADVA